MDELRVNVDDVQVTAACYQASAGRLADGAPAGAGRSFQRSAAAVQAVHASGGIGDVSHSKGTEMTIFRAGFFPNFNWGDDVVLVGADRDGMRMFQSAVRSAHEAGAATFEFDAVKHYIVRQDGAADIDLGSQTVVWRFDDANC